MKQLKERTKQIPDKTNQPKQAKPTNHTHTHESENGQRKLDCESTEKIKLNLKRLTKTLLIFVN